MDAVLRSLLRFNALLARGEAIVLVAALAVMTSVVFLQVVYRYILAQPLHWSEEFARYLFVWLSVLGAAHAMYQRRHFGFDSLFRLLPERTKPFASFFIHALMGVVVFVMLFRGISLVDKTLAQESPAMGIPMGWAYASLPVGAVLMAVHLVAILIDELAGRKCRP